MSFRDRSTDTQQPQDLSLVQGRLPFANLTQGSALSVLGVTGNATADNASIAAGSDGQVMRRSGTAIAFGAVDLASANSITGALPVARLGNGTTTSLTSSTTSNQNNWAPGLVGDTVISWSGAGDITVTGFAGGVSGQKVKFVNTGTNIATFSHQSGSSSAGNKFRNIATSAGTPVAGGGYIEFQYDGTDWRLVNYEQGAWITPTYAGGNYTAVAAMTWTVDSGDVTTQAYRLDGRTLTVSFFIATSTVGGVVSTALLIGNGAWGGFTSTKSVLGGNIAYADAAGVTTAGIWQITAAGTSLSLFKSPVANWTASANNTSVYGSVTFEVS